MNTATGTLIGFEVPLHRSLTEPISDPSTADPAGPGAETTERTDLVP